MKPKKRYYAKCNASLPKGADRWYIMDRTLDAKVARHGYYTTRAEAEEYCKELNQKEPSDV